jgi:hypothetical protein
MDPTKTALKECGLDSLGLECGPMAGSCEHTFGLYGRRIS